MDSVLNNWAKVEIIYTWENYEQPAVQHGHAADAASRPQDPSFFGRRYRLDCFPDLSVAAQLMGKPLGRTRTHPVCSLL